VALIGGWLKGPLVLNAPDLSLMGQSWDPKGSRKGWGLGLRGPQVVFAIAGDVHGSSCHKNCRSAHGVTCEP
jgi:hypothetical protein